MKSWRNLYLRYQNGQNLRPARVFFNLSGQQIPWGRDRHKHFWNSRGFNFVSFKGMFRKLMKAIILDSRNILD